MTPSKTRSAATPKVAARKPASAAKTLPSRTATSAPKAAAAKPAKPAKSAKPVASPKATKPAKSSKPAMPAKPAKPAKAVKAAKPAKLPKAPKPPKAPKQREALVRDSFTMPKAEFDLIGLLKQRALDAKRPAKKSELLRAGLQLLATLESSALVAALERLVPLKPGRPKKSH